MTTNRSRTTITLALAAAVLAGGCGSSGSKSLSRSELIAKADPICQRANAAFSSAKLDPQNVAQVGPEVAAADRQAAAELAKLTPPSSMTADWKVILDGFRNAGNGLQNAAAIAKSAGSPKGLIKSKAFDEAIAQLTKGEQDRQNAASNDGFNNCGEI